jgi:hypothetical protein
MGFQATNVNVAGSDLTALANKHDLTKEEIEFILVLIKNSNFKGDMIEVVYNLVIKLQNRYKQLNK